MARSYVLDTHACVFMLAAPKKLGAGARAALRRVLGSIADPFDRLIVSAARSKGAILITRDATVAEGGLVETLW